MVSTMQNNAKPCSKRHSFTQQHIALFSEPYDPYNAGQNLTTKETTEHDTIHLQFYDQNTTRQNIASQDTTSQNKKSQHTLILKSPHYNILQHSTPQSQTEHNYILELYDQFTTRHHIKTQKLTLTHSTEHYTLIL